MEEQNSNAIAAFDSLFTTNQIQMLKILLPRLAPEHQGGFAVYTAVRLYFSAAAYGNAPFRKRKAAVR